MKGKWYGPMVVQLFGLIFAVTFGVFADRLVHQIHDKGPLKVSFCFVQVDDNSPPEVVRRACDR